MAELFTEDILIEILLRLPAKSLMRFKCVGKRWRSLISNPGFAKSHLQRLMARDSIPSQRIFKTSPFESIDYELHDGGIGGGDDLAVVKVHELRIGDPYWEPDLVGSCHGLVCLRVPGRFYLYNPTTKESRNFPCSDLVPQYELVNGFGYDPRSDDYKIVQAGGSKKWQEAIFSLKSGSWRRIQVQRESHPAYFKRGVYWNGALHWCLFELSRNKNETAIMSFDLSEEKFHRVLPVPEVDEVDGGVLFTGLGIHGANLFIYQETYNNDCIEAWITNEYRRGRSWTKWFSVSTKRIPGYTYCQTIPVTYTRSGKIVFLIDMGKMILFNPKDNTCKDYPIRRRDGYVESAIYLETLVSPYLGCGPSII